MANNSTQVNKGGKYGDLKRRLLFLLGALVVYRIGAHVPVQIGPGVGPVNIGIGMAKADIQPGAIKADDLSAGQADGGPAIVFRDRDFTRIVQRGVGQADIFGFREMVITSSPAVKSVTLAEELASAE